MRIIFQTEQNEDIKTVQEQTNKRKKIRKPEEFGV